MKRVILLALLSLSGCASTPDKAEVKSWAVATAKSPDPAPPSCGVYPPPPVMSGSKDGAAAAREYQKLMAAYLALLKEHDKCGAWARGQR